MSLDWARLYEAHARELQHYLAKLTGDWDGATDLMQDTFVRAMSAEIAEPQHARAWLFRAATNAAVSRARRQRIIAFLPFHEDAPASRTSFDEEGEQVRSALSSIPTDQAATLLLHYHCGFSRSEIAAMDGLSEETVKSRLARGRKNFVAAYRRLERGLAH